MIRIVIGNYLLTGVILASYSLIDLLVARNMLAGEPNSTIERLATTFGDLLTTAKPTIILIIYFILLLWIATRSRIGLGYIHSDLSRWGLTLLYIPFTVISIIANLALAIFGTKVLDITQLGSLASIVRDNVRLHNLILLTPLWILLPGIITVVLASYSLIPRLEMQE
jgi:hypothetical protein